MNIIACFCCCCCLLFVVVVVCFELVLCIITIHKRDECHMKRVYLYTPLLFSSSLPHFSPTPHSLTSPYSTTLLGSVPTLQLVITNIHTSNQTMKLSMCQICLWVSVYYGTFLKSGDERGEEGKGEGIGRHTGSCSKPVPVAKQHTIRVTLVVYICTNLK